MNNSFIAFIMGPMVWISAFIFLGGLLIKFISIIRSVRQKESYIFSYLTFKHSFRSIGAWLIPFLPQSTRLHPVYYGISYLFHILLFVIPLFLASHIVLINEALQISWPALNDSVADWLTLLVIVFLIFFCPSQANGAGGEIFNHDQGLSADSDGNSAFYHGIFGLSSIFRL